MKQRLTICKSCKQHISKSAKRCPHCGALQHQAAYVFISIISVLFIFTIVMAFFSFPDSPPNAEQKINSPVASAPLVAAEVTAHSLWDAYEANTVNADGLYKDKLISVTGTISNIGQDAISKAPCIFLDSGDSLGAFPIQCFFPKNGVDTDKISALNDGDTITLYGKCTGFQVAYVQLSACYLPD